MALPPAETVCPLYEFFIVGLDLCSCTSSDCPMESPRGKQERTGCARELNKIPQRACLSRVETGVARTLCLDYFRTAGLFTGVPRVSSFLKPNGSLLPYVLR